MITDVSRIRITGPLEPFAAGFAEELARRGYSPLSAADQVRLLAHLSRWMRSECLAPEALCTERLEAFLGVRRAAGYTRWLSARGLAPLLGYLRSVGVVPAEQVASPAGLWEELLERYASYLAAERGLLPSAVAGYVRLARRFLTGLEADGDNAGLAGLGGDELTRFVLAECGATAVGTAKLTLTQLRSLLRFLHLEGHIATDLSGVVPAVAGWRNAGIPKYLEPKQLRAILGACDRRTADGRRDFSILVIMARLGLRRGEVATLDLDDLDWRAGEMVVKGKGRRDERLPLTADVGEAIAAYLRQGRRRDTAERAVFLATRAPYRRISPSAVTAVVHRACLRAGLEPIGAHQLRHTAATEMLRAGSSLVEVGQVLRHRHLSTTAIYAKVDHRSLRELARPWPEMAADGLPRAGLRDLALPWPEVLA